MRQDERAAPPTRPADSNPAAPWQASAWVSDLDGPVHWIEFDGPARRSADAVPVVFVHGLGGSHLNWVLVGPALAAERRAVALDLRGFGLTPGRGWATGVAANTALLDRFLREVVGRPAVLVANSMGGLISIMQAYSAPDTVAGLVLLDPALPSAGGRPDPQVALQFMMYAIPMLGEMYLRAVQSRLSSRELVERLIALCFAHPELASPEVIAAGIRLADERRAIPGKEESFLRAARSLLRVTGRPRRYRAVMRQIQAPTFLINGEADRLVPLAAARRAAADNPGWRSMFLPDVGHTPQLEVPATVVSAITDWLVSEPSLTTR